ncbi:hypothetical protein BDA99DRAFT_521215 [Phascolomyces articulosus]|uniref:Uncharacterized protein n=1 Tax=Phascolomyces articulosus TaxID=60185 RepID=A0AAD5PBM7_9FUNG|nr:hypothetical protein BDA99DRAFT_521215 [Phascolomyces articulosus]
MFLLCIILIFHYNLFLYLRPTTNKYSQEYIYVYVLLLKYYSSLPLYCFFYSFTSTFSL